MIESAEFHFIHRHAELVSASIPAQDAQVKQPCVYILASKFYGTIYVGVTSDLVGRLYQHRTKLVRGFTSKYGVCRLVRFELFEDMNTAIAREKQIKNWRRPWKINLIESENPQWVDLAPGLGLPPLLPD